MQLTWVFQAIKAGLDVLSSLYSTLSGSTQIATWLYYDRFLCELWEIALCHPLWVRLWQMGDVQSIGKVKVWVSANLFANIA